MTTVEIKAFGAFRGYFPSGAFAVSLEAPFTVADLKRAIQSSLAGRFRDFDEALVQDSALATDSRILRDQDVLNGDEDIAILPPVCGG